MILTPQFIIYTDGGCDVNPGGKGGYGSVVTDTATGVVTELSQGYLSTTNNRMEIMGVIAAMEFLPAGSSAVVYCDSQYVVKTMNGQYKKKKNTDLWSRLAHAMNGKTVEFQWVHGHSGVSGNERCDTLATDARNTCPLLEDSGYHPPAPSPLPGSSEPASETADSSLPPPTADDAAAGSYAEEHLVSLSCARAILTFQSKSSHRFRDYTALKTGGLDVWSRSTLDEILEIIPDSIPAWDRFCTELGNTPDAMSALRWFARGLSADDAVRKVKTDLEIRNRVQKN